MSENSLIEQGLYCAALWPRNFLIHSMIFHLMVAIWYQLLYVGNAQTSIFFFKTLRINAQWRSIPIKFTLLVPLPISKVQSIIFLISCRIDIDRHLALVFDLEYFAFFPPAYAVEGIKSVLSVCVCVSVSLSVIQHTMICNECLKLFQARILTKRARRGRARQRSGVFIVTIFIFLTIFIDFLASFAGAPNFHLRCNAFTTFCWH